MSSNPKTPTRELLIEACPDCHAVHCYQVVNDKIRIDGQPIEKVLCPTVIGHREPTPEEKEASKEKEDSKAALIPLTCGYEVVPKPENLFTIRLWTYRERQLYYEKVGAYAPQSATPGQTASIKLNINSSVLDYVITSCIVKSPQPLKTTKDLDNTTIDGAVIETLYGEITEYNAPPLAPSSTSLQRSTRQIRNSVRAMS